VTVTGHEAWLPLVVDVPDFPEPGILFKDIAPVLSDGPAFAAVVGGLAEACRQLGADTVVGIEARGFILAAPVAVALQAGFVPVRKPGKLPRETHSVAYGLEYGQGTLHLHTDALRRGERVVIVDDVLATGGTLAGTAELVARTGATVAGAVVLLEIAFLGGRANLGDLPVRALASV
jgi:adenine phosphoribosyltransferase